MGRGVSSGGGQSSLGYLFGGGEAPKPTTNTPEASQHNGQVASNGPPQKSPAASPIKPTAAAPQGDAIKQIPAGIQGSQTNNYFRADGQNTGNFITERPSTKVHATPGGGSFSRLPVWWGQQMIPLIVMLEPNLLMFSSFKSGTKKI